MQMNFHYDICCSIWMDAQAGPHGFSGPIGKSLEECEKLPVVEFDKIEADMPASEMTDLSTDHKYLEEMCKLLQLVIAPWICPEEIQVDLRIRDGLQLQTESYVCTLELKDHRLIFEYLRT